MVETVWWKHHTVNSQLTNREGGNTENWRDADGAHGAKKEHKIVSVCEKNMDCAVEITVSSVNPFYVVGYLVVLY